MSSSSVAPWSGFSQETTASLQRHTTTEVVLFWLGMLLSCVALVVSVAAYVQPSTTTVVPVPVTVTPTVSSGPITSGTILAYTVGPNDYNNYTSIAPAVAEAEAKATAASPIVVRVEPGTYDATLTIHSTFVSVEGTEASTTFLTGNLTVADTGSFILSRVTWSAGATLTVMAGGTLQLQNSNLAGTVTNSAALTGSFELSNVACTSTAAVNIQGGKTVFLYNLQGPATVTMTNTITLDSTFSYTFQTCNVATLNIINLGTYNGPDATHPCTIKIYQSILTTLSLTGTPVATTTYGGYRLFGCEVKNLTCSTDYIILSNTALGENSTNTASFGVRTTFYQCYVNTIVTWSAAPTGSVTMNCRNSTFMYAVTGDSVLGFCSFFNNTITGSTVALSVCRAANVVANDAGLTPAGTVSFASSTAATVTLNGTAVGGSNFYNCTLTKIVLTGGRKNLTFTNCSCLGFTTALTLCDNFSAKNCVFTTGDGATACLTLTGTAGNTVSLWNCTMVTPVVLTDEIITISNCTLGHGVSLTNCTTVVNQCSTYAPMATTTYKTYVGAFYVDGGSLTLCNLYAANAAGAGQTIVNGVNAPTVNSWGNNAAMFSGGTFANVAVTTPYTLS